MTNVTLFESNKKINETNTQDEDKGRWTNHFDEEAAKYFGTYMEWDNIAVMHLMEQMMNYMNTADEYGGLYATHALNVAIMAHQEKNCEVPIREYINGLHYYRTWNYSEEDGQAGEVTKALEDICDFLYEKYPDL